MAIEEKDITEETYAKGLNNKDLEKNFEDTPPESIKEEDAIARRFPMVRKLATYGVELRGIQPVPVEERKDTRIVNLFSLWFTASTCLLPIATGMSGTLTYGLSLRDASLVILFFTLLSCAPVAWMGMMGPKTGMRQMIQARYYFGLYLIAIIVLLQLATLTGFTIISAIVSGQTLSAISGGSLSLSVGIVITALIGLGISFMGYKFLHNFERYSWIPTLIAIVITVGYGGKNLFLQVETEAPAASTILSYGSIVAGFLISWSTLVSDFAVYISPEVSKIRIFSYVYVGLALPTILLMVLGAAIGGAVPNVPAWAAADLADSTGGVMRAMLLPAGGFGKFVAVLLAFSVIGNVGASLYSVSVNFQVVLPFLVYVPRYVFSIVITAILIPVSIVVAKNFYESLGNFLGVIGYWAAAFIGISLTEHHFFRNGDPASYDPAIWNVGSKLPMGIAALASGALSFAIIIPCMDEVWFTGPIAKTTGDIGFEVGFVASILLYIPLRTLEKKLTGR